MSTVSPCPILLPKNADMAKWAVIACDQHVADRKYWSDLEKLVGDAPSALNLIFPEIFLNDRVDARISRINRAMRKYLDEGLFEEINGYVLTRRVLRDGRVRTGLIVSVDLEEYGADSPVGAIRPTEETLEERMPVRIRIRKNAPLELPHALLLFDDPDRAIVEPIAERRASLKKLYDFDLNMGGGRITGREVPFDALPQRKFDALADPAAQTEKYGRNAGVLFVVGDGNHSMAAARRCWDELKPTLSAAERETCPARFALVEIANIRDPGLDFLPIHRVVRADDLEAFASKLAECLSGSGRMTAETRAGRFEMECPERAEETIVAAQRCIEEELAAGRISVDYAHDPAQAAADALECDGIALFMPAFPKERLFEYAIRAGRLPKKAFSIGEEYAKKYYIESKRMR